MLRHLGSRNQLANGCPHSSPDHAPFILTICFPTNLFKSFEAPRGLAQFVELLVRIAKRGFLNRCGLKVLRRCPPLNA